MAATQHPPAPASIWYGIFAAPVAFGIQEMLDWLISSGACPSGNPADIGGMPLFTSTRAILWGIGAAALVIAAVALGIGIGAWRQSHDPSFLSIRARQRPDYLAAAAMLVSAVFLIAILWQTIGVFVLPECGLVR
ncbi:MAG TPA: hypothetical protein VHV80_05270 [Steroidobacteraceae bacterium]|jgi:hypothetical protein|nr:hypothetical protein [Steroidobacteraceae bacterium]